MMFDSPRSRPQVVMTDSVPAPVGGLNYRDSAAAMPVTDAIRMINFQPLPYAVAVRKGWEEWGTGYHGTVETICNHAKPDGTQQIIAAANSCLYAQTAPGAAAAPTATGFSDDYWLHTMMSNSGGTFTYMVNGVDAPQVWNGTAFTAVAQDDTDPQGFDVGGVDPKLFINVTLHQRRLWFVEKNSLRMWYLPVDQVGGVAVEFDLGPVMSLGGHLVAMASWTVDAGTGMDDYAAFVSSMGQVAVYTGTDPDQVGAWGLQGVFSIGSPVGLRCLCKYGGEVLIITRDGLLPMSKALQSTRVHTNIALTDKLQQLISALISEHGNDRGWECFQFPNENQLWLTVPHPDGVRLLSMNTITGAWCEYAGLNAASLCLLDDYPLMGLRDGRIGLAWQGYQDDVKLATGQGEYIFAEVLTAYNYFNSPGRNKRWVLARPIFQSGSTPASAIGISVDFSVYEETPDITTSDAVSNYPLWGLAKWGVDRWPGVSTRYRNWVSLLGIGYCAALSLRVKQATALVWTATDFAFEPGSVV